MKKNDSDVIIIEVSTTMLRLIIINKESNKIIATSSVSIDYIKRGVVKDVEALTRSIRSLVADTNKNYLNNHLHLLETDIKKGILKMLLT